MKKILLASAITVATATSSMAAAKHSFYAGLGLAGLTGHHNATLTYASPGVATETDNYGFSKYTVGGDIMLGYMGMVNNLMFGLEVDYLFGNVNRTNTISFSPTFGRTIQVRSTSGAWGAGLRLGYSCLERVVPYVRLGVEYRRFKLTHYAQDTGLPSMTEINSTAGKAAFAPGVGMDFKVNKNLALGLEYRYAFYSSITKTGFNPNVPRTTTFKLNPRIGTGLITLKYIWGNN